eukprot:SAG11_NODE_30914_length_296_cov_1.045685_1_plen_56_part_10
MSGRSAELVETFEDGPAGWLRWGSARTLDEVQGGGAFSSLEWAAAAGEDGAHVTSR